MILRPATFRNGSAAFFVPLVLGVLAILAAGGYFSYFWGRGVESYTVSGRGFTRSSQGYHLGFKKFQLASGQGISVEYVITSRRAGILSIYFKSDPALGLPKRLSKKC